MGKIKNIIENLPFKVNGYKTIRKSGVMNDKYFLIANKKKLILRIPKNEFVESLDLKKNEHKALKILRRRKFVPGVIYFDHSRKLNKFSYIILEYIEGKNFKFSFNDIERIARILKDVHSVTFKKWGLSLLGLKSNYSLGAYVAGRLKGYLPVTKDAKGREFMKKILNRLIGCIKSNGYDRNFKHKQFSLQHGDLNKDNFIKNKLGNIFLIDWEFAQVCPPARDIAELFFQNKFNAKQQEFFLCKYGSQDSNLIDEIKIWIIILKIDELFDKIRGGKFNAEIREKMNGLINKLV